MTQYHRLHARKGLTAGLLAIGLLAFGGWLLYGLYTQPVVEGTAGAVALYGLALVVTGLRFAVTVYSRYRLYRRTRPE